MRNTYLDYLQLGLVDPRDIGDDLELLDSEHIVVIHPDGRIDDA